MQWISAVKPDPADSAQDRRAVIDFAKTAVPKLLSYTPDTVEADLQAAAELTGGAFRESYTTATRETVVPGAQQRRIVAKATVPGAAVTTLTDDNAELVVFVNQTVTSTTFTEPTSTTSSVRLRLERADGNWLITAFDPL